MPTSISYGTRIVQELSKFGSAKHPTENPESKHNVGRLLGEVFLWKTIMDYAKKRHELALDKCEEAYVNQTYDEGVHEVITSPRFSFTLRVSARVRRFNPDVLAAEFRKKFKIPEPVTKELVEAAKVPTESTITKIIGEKGASPPAR